MNDCYNRAGGAATRLYESSSVSSAISLYYNSDGETHAERETENAPVELVICCAARSAGNLLHMESDLPNIHATLDLRRFRGN